ncbi:MAG: CpaD family pilus assembly protein [Sphingomonadales bacterium]|nr:CpaD family pilus assembly protein [Sphingomonadales bacterium]MDE2567632.1 CpaD family pilus assembly protein [Sphingomonadales bacterium]
MSVKLTRSVSAALVLSLGLSLGGCGGIPTNRSLYSTKQPVVQRHSYVLDVNTLPGGGMSVPEQQRLSGWFQAMKLRYGDRVSVDDPTQSPVTRGAVEGVASRYGMLVSDVAPVTPGDIVPGTARVVVSRSTAEVPGCPDWSAKSDFNPNNATFPGYGCAINGNLAAMVADPEHLVRGAENTGDTVILSNSKAIDSYRSQKPTGEGGLKTVSSQSGGN